MHTASAEPPRFYLPNWIARPILGRRRFLMLPTASLVDEVQFRGIKALHKPAMRRFIFSGDLSPWLEPVTSSATAQEVGEIMDADLRYQKTWTYWARLWRLKQGVRQKFHARHFHSIDDIDEFFKYQVRLIRSMMTHGCLSQRDLSERHRQHVPEYSARRPAEHDIGVAIGPRGQTWMFRTGHHRLHIARRLGIERIPVEVHLVHRDWLKLVRVFRPPLSPLDIVP